VVQTPVTSAPKALASWTAKVPTLPPRLRSALLPRLALPELADRVQAVRPEIGTAAAWPKVRFAGLGASLSLLGAGLLGEGPLADPEDLVAGVEPGHARPDGLHAPPECRCV
jgi:hypothetical protein